MTTVEDELDLRRLMDRYIDAVNRRDGGDWAATWAEDATWSLMGKEVSGRDNIVTQWQQMIEGFEFAIMMPSSGSFEVQGDSATGHWYLQEFTRDVGGNAALVLGHYRDTYIRAQKHWLYQTRHYNVIYYGPTDLSGQYSALIKSKA
ncbi:MAG: nuclear transport factor 2 family protein [Pseudomonadales bacterium]